MTPTLWLLQAVALLNANELNGLMGAIAFLWASLCGAVAIVWQLLKRNWAQMEVRMAQLEARTESITALIYKLLGEHEVADRQRHEAQMDAINANAAAYTAPWAAMQEAQKTQLGRIESLEDSGVMVKRGKR